MTTMTDEAAKQIAQKTIQKFEDADKNAFLVMTNDKSHVVYRTENTKPEDIVDVFVNVLYELSPSRKDFIKNLKLITKIAKKESK